MDRMKTLWRVAAATTALALVPVFADHHESAAAEAETAVSFNVQAQLCTLHPGKTMAQYDKMVQGYFNWAKKHDVEVLFVRQTPLFTHANATTELEHEFAEFLISNYETSGDAWDKWLSTEDGQKLNATWQELASCHVKMGALYMQWADQAALDTDDDRIVTWDWCTRKEGVSSDQLKAKHDSIVAAYPEGLANIAWAVFVPQIGGANAPGDFANIVAYPDVKSLMARQKWLNEDEGWRAMRDYYTSYASCSGPSASIEQVLNRPGQ